MNKYLLLFSLIAFRFLGFSQQVPFYNHNIINPFIFNPSMAGASGDVSAYLVRNQRYNSFSGPSINNYLTVDGRMREGSKHGFGLQVSHQAHGIQQQFASSLAYSYAVPFSSVHELRFGLSAGLLDNRIDLGGVNVAQTDDPYLMAMRPNVTSFDMNAGLSYRWNALRIGFAIPQLIGNKVSYNKENARGYYRLSRHMMLTAEYDFALTKNLILKPYALLRYVPGAPLQYDIMAHLDHRKLGWITVGYKSDYSIQANIGFRIMDQFKVGYSYEYLIGSMKNYSTGAHNEIMLAYIFRPRRKDIVQTVEKVVEVEKIVEVEKVVENAETQKENEELKRRNRELEEMLAATLAEKEKLKEEEHTQEAVPPVTHDSVPEKTTTPPVKELEKLPYAKGYHFIELSLSDSPDGFYVIGGVYSSKKNAENALKKNQASFPASYLVINQKNGFYYVVVLYTLDQEEAQRIFRNYKRSSHRDAWILNYRLDQ